MKTVLPISAAIAIIFIIYVWPSRKAGSGSKIVNGQLVSHQGEDFY